MAPVELLRRSIEKAYNDATQKFILMKAGDSYILGDHFIKYDGGTYSIFNTNGCLYNEILIIEAAIALSYSLQVDNIAMVLEIRRIIRAYDKHHGDVVIYRRQLDTFTSSGNYDKLDYIESRLCVSTTERMRYRNKLKVHCIRQVYKLKTIDKYS